MRDDYSGEGYYEGPIPAAKPDVISKGCADLYKKLVKVAGMFFAAGLGAVVGNAVPYELQNKGVQISPETVLLANALGAIAALVISQKFINRLSRGGDIPSNSRPDENIHGGYF